MIGSYKQKNLQVTNSESLKCQHGEAMQILIKSEKAKEKLAKRTKLNTVSHNNSKRKIRMNISQFFKRKINPLIFHIFKQTLYCIITIFYNA